MIQTEDQARQVAIRYIAEVVEPSVGEEVVISRIRQYPTCWVIGYNTKVFIETGAVDHALAGGPIIVNRETGDLRIGSSGLPAEEQLDP